jgi:hypothetical protein
VRLDRQIARGKASMRSTDPAHRVRHRMEPSGRRRLKQVGRPCDRATGRPRALARSAGRLRRSSHRDPVSGQSDVVCAVSGSSHHRYETNLLGIRMVKPVMQLLARLRLSPPTSMRSASPAPSPEARIRSTTPSPLSASRRWCGADQRA